MTSHDWKAMVRCPSVQVLILAAALKAVDCVIDSFLGE